MPSSGSVLKHIKKSGSQAFVELTDTLNSYVSTLMAPPMEHSPAAAGLLSASPARKDAAFRTVIEEEGLSPHSLSYAWKVFRGNVELANEYLSFGLESSMNVFILMCVYVENIPLDSLSTSLMQLYPDKLQLLYSQLVIPLYL